MEKQNNTSIGLAILSLIIPLVGWIMYFVKYSTDPKSADVYGICGIVGFILNIIIYITC